VKSHGGIWEESYVSPAGDDKVRKQSKCKHCHQQQVFSTVGRWQRHLTGQATMCIHCCDATGEMMKFDEFSMSDATGEMMKFDVTDMDEIEALVNRDTSLTMDTSVSQKYFKNFLQDNEPQKNKDGDFEAFARDKYVGNLGKRRWRACGGLQGRNRRNSLSEETRGQLSQRILPSDRAYQGRRDARPFRWGEADLHDFGKYAFRVDTGVPQSRMDVPEQRVRRSGPSGGSAEAGQFLTSLKLGPRG